MSRRHLTLGGAQAGDGLYNIDDIDFNQAMSAYQKAKHEYETAEKANDAPEIGLAHEAMDDAEDHIIALGGSLMQCAYPPRWITDAMHDPARKRWMKRRGEALQRIIDRREDD